MSPIRVVYLATTLALVACADLPPIDAQTCGNAIVEPENLEECDTHASAPAVCRPPTSTVGACRFDCTSTACPTGYGCGTDGICRQGTGNLVTLARGIDAVSSLRLADLNGDGRDDLVTQSVLGLQATYSSASGTPAESSRLALERGRFVTGRLQSGTEDSSTSAPETLVILDTDFGNVGATQGATGGGLSVYRGSTQSELLPTLYPSIPVNADEVRIAAGRLSKRIGQLGVGSDILVFTDISAHPGTLGQRGQGYSLGHFALAADGSSANLPLLSLPELEPSLASGTAAARIAVAPVSGPLVAAYTPRGFPAALPYPCDTLAWSQLGGTDGPGSVWLLPLCHLDAAVFNPLDAARSVSYLPNYIPSGAEVGPVRRARLVPPAGAVVSGAAVLRDVPRFVPTAGAVAAHFDEPDGLLDVLVASTDGLLVGYGDGTWTISDPPPTGLNDASRDFALVPYPGIAASSPPLAFGDFNGDGDLDWVDATGIHYNPVHQPLLAQLAKPFGRSVQIARVVDFDRDGVDDVAAGGAGGFAIYRGVRASTVYPTANQLDYPLAGTVTQLTTGDFDGDGLPDLGFITRAAAAGGTIDSAGVSYGSVGFPLPPTSLGSLARLDLVLSARFSWLLSGVPDAIDSFLAFGLTNSGVPAAITWQGRANRQMNSRFGLTTAAAPLRRGIALGAEAGWFSGSASSGTPQGLMILASSVEVSREQAATGDVTFRIWFTPSTGAAQLDTATVQSSSPLFSVPGIDGAVSAEAVSAATAQLVAAGIGAADLDGDGIDEGIFALPATANGPARLLVANPGSGPATDTSIVVTASALAGGGALGASGGNGAVRVRTGDVDGDGHVDVLVLRALETELVATLFYGDGSKTLDEARSITLPALGLVDVAIVAGRGGGSTVMGLTGSAVVSVQIARERGAVSLGDEAFPHGASGVHDLASGDLDGDGVEDLAIGSDTGFVLLRGIPVLQ